MGLCLGKQIIIDLQIVCVSAVGFVPQFIDITQHNLTGLFQRIDALYGRFIYHMTDGAFQNGPLVHLSGQQIPPCVNRPIISHLRTEYPCIIAGMRIPVFRNDRLGNNSVANAADFPDITVLIK